VDLEAMSEGQLELHEGHSSLDTLAYSASKKDKAMQQRGTRTNTRNKTTQSSAGRSKDVNSRKRSFGSGNVSNDNTNNFRKRKK
jgi:hypothetical protein